MRRLHWAALVAIFFSLDAATSFADPSDKGDKHDKGADRGRPATPSSASPSANASDDDDDNDSAPSGKPGRRTPAQLSFRKTVWERNEKAVEARAHKDGQHLSDAGKAAIQEHWLRVAKLLRIRELAEEDKQDAIVKRVDAQLEKEEKKIDGKLEKLQAKADGGAK
jgi:hypothetical protein